MFLSKNKFLVVVNSTMYTEVLRKNKKFLQKNSNLGRFRCANIIFSRWTFVGGLNRIKPVGFNRTGLFMPRFNGCSPGCAIYYLMKLLR